MLWFFYAVAAGVGMVFLNTLYRYIPVSTKSILYFSPGWFLVSLAVYLMFTYTPNFITSWFVLAGTCAVLQTLVGTLHFQENLGTYKILGIILCIISLILMNLKR